MPEATPLFERIDRPRRLPDEVATALIAAIAVVVAGRRLSPARRTG